MLWVWQQKWVSGPWISNYIMQCYVVCNYLFMPYMSASGTKVWLGVYCWQYHIQAKKLSQWQFWVIESVEGSQINTLRPRWNRCPFADDTFKCIFVNENVWISLKISLTFVPKFHINNIPALVQIMAWRRPGDKPLSEPMMVSLLRHTCVFRPQWVNNLKYL